MPIEHEVDDERRLVIAKGRGTLTDQDIFEYQRGVWSRPEVAGYDELIDMSEVENIALPSTERVRDLAKLSVTMDDPGFPAKLAIVAPKDFAFALGRLYEAYRGLDPRSMKTVSVFRSVEDALTWLGSERRAT